MYRTNQEQRAVQNHQRPIGNRLYIQENPNPGRNTDKERKTNPKGEQKKHSIQNPLRRMSEKVRGANNKTLT